LSRLPGRQIQPSETTHPAKLSGLPCIGKISLTIGTLGYRQGRRVRAAADSQGFTAGAIAGTSTMAAKAKKTDDEDDVEASGDGAESTEGEKPKSRLKLILIAVGAVAVLGGGGGGGYFMFFGHKEAKPEVAVVKPPAFFDMPEVLVNLSNATGDRTQYLKVKIVLELPDSTMQPHVQNTMPRVMDAFQTYLRELRPSDLEGSAGLYRLKEELTRRVNVAIAPSRINAVLFKEIVVQ
jgi:flagellar protein FliL